MESRRIGVFGCLEWGPGRAYILYTHRMPCVSGVVDSDPCVECDGACGGESGGCFVLVWMSCVEGVSVRVGFCREERCEGCKD